MVEKLLEQNEALLLDTPYLRRIRETSLAEGVQIGLEKGQQIGLEKGQQIGLEKGQLIGLERGVQSLREAILEAVANKFNPSLAEYRRLEKELAQLHEPAVLQKVLLALFDVQDVAAILTLVNDLTDKAE